MRRLLVLILLLVAVVIAVKPLRVAAQTAILIPSLMDASLRPLDWVSGEPKRETLAYRGAGSSDRADLWLPDGASRDGRVGAVLLVFGVNNVGRGHPAIQRVAASFARSGVAVLVPDSAVLLEGRLEPREIDGVVQAFATLRDRPEVDRERVGIAGFSAGGSLALLAAADRRIADDVAYVNAFGAFAGAREYVANLAAHAYELDGKDIPWRPTPLALEGFPRLVLSQLGEGSESALIADALIERLARGERVSHDPALERRLGRRAAPFYRLLTAPDLDAARRAVDRLPAPTRQLLDALSPLRHLDGVRAPVHLMHERDDHHVPYVESQKLAAALEGGGAGRLVRHTEFRLFTHVQPDKLDPVAATPEFWKLLWHVHALMMETV